MIAEALRWIGHAFVVNAVVLVLCYGFAIVVAYTGQSSNVRVTKP